MRDCQALDERLAHLIGDQCGIPHATREALILSTSSAARFLAEAGSHPGNSIHCATALALLGELLLCAKEGGILDKQAVERFAGGDKDRRKIGEAVRLLRNTVCHPGDAKPHKEDKETALDALLRHVETEFREEPWVPDIRETAAKLKLDNIRAITAKLNNREVALFALRCIGLTGWWQAEQWGLRLRVPRLDHRRSRPSGRRGR